MGKVSSASVQVRQTLTPGLTVCHQREHATSVLEYTLRTGSFIRGWELHRRDLHGDAAEWRWKDPVMVVCRLRSLQSAGCGVLSVGTVAWGMPCTLAGAGGGYHSYAGGDARPPHVSTFVRWCRSSAGTAGLNLRR